MPDAIGKALGWPFMAGLRLGDAFGVFAAGLALVALGGLGVVWFAGEVWGAMPW